MMEFMPRDYRWARKFIPHDCATIGELGILLGLGRHEARRRLLKSGLPCRLITRRWKNPDGAWQVRRTYAIPVATAEALFYGGIEREWKRDVRFLRRLGVKVPPHACTPPRELFGDVNQLG